MFVSLTLKNNERILINIHKILFVCPTIKTGKANVHLDDGTILCIDCPFEDLGEILLKK